jgi:catechol 2,3-dioxygenase-like lactoylglutathione lyase family enzyme
MTIRNPGVTLYSTDLPRAVAFYEGLGFREAFRFPDEGPVVHIELTLDGFTLGIADIAVAAGQHGFDVSLGGHTAELVLWCDDTDGLFARLVGEGAPAIAPPHDWLDDLRIAWIADPDGNPIQLVQRRELTPPKAMPPCGRPRGQHHAPANAGAWRSAPTRTDTRSVPTAASLSDSDDAAGVEVGAGGVVEAEGVDVDVVVVGAEVRAEPSDRGGGVAEARDDAGRRLTSGAHVSMLRGHCQICGVSGSKSSMKPVMKRRSSMSASLLAALSK